MSDVRKAVSNIKQKDLQSELLRLEKELEGQGFSVDSNMFKTSCSTNSQPTGKRSSCVGSSLPQTLTLAS